MRIVHLKTSQVIDLAITSMIAIFLAWVLAVYDNYVLIIPLFLVVCYCILKFCEIFKPNTIALKSYELENLYAYSVEKVLAESSGISGLQWSSLEESWLVRIKRSNGSIVLMIPHDSIPDSPSLQHARYMVENIDNWEALVYNYLAIESGKYRKHTNLYREINNLKIESIVLSASPSNVSTVYFNNNESDRVWRCDLTDLTPFNLGFDD